MSQDSLKTIAFVQLLWVNYNNNSQYALVMSREKSIYYPTFLKYNKRDNFGLMLEQNN